MRLKDYYRTLGVPVSATAADIRKAFRRLALAYHPDRNPESPFAAGHFRELKEAYGVLGDAARRKRYDEERWLAGIDLHRPGSGRLTPEWIAAEAAKLNRHMQRIDAYRMNHDALQAYVLLLLGDEHLAVIKEPAQAAGLVKDILASVSRLRTAMLPPVAARLYLLAGSDETLLALINDTLAARARKEKEEQAFPWIIVLIILAVTVLTLWMLAVK